MPRLLLALLLLIQCTTFAQSSLPRSTPEAEGVSSAGIIKYLDAIAASKHEMHSFMLVRHGKVVAEGWWNPYRADLRHTMYSCSKSFTATAVGLAITEGKLKLDDKVISFFPDKLPDTVKPWLSKLTVQDVLMMSDGMKPDPTAFLPGVRPDWTKGFLATPIVEEPGTTFLYNSMGTYMLSAIVQKVTGQKVIDYLKPRLFDPLGINGADWEENLMGVNVGGWGLRIKTEDMAKFAQLFLQKGQWNGKTILPESWVADATTAHIMQDPNAPQSKKDSSDWLQGYCYQMWRCRHNAYRGDGAFGQYMLVMPELDAVMAITSESADLQGELDLVWDHILPAIKKEKLKEDKAGLAKLQARLKALALPPPVNKPTLASMQAIHAKTFAASSNNAHIKGYVFQFDQGVCHFTLQTDTADYKIDLGGGQWLESMTNKPQQTLTSRGLEDLRFLYPAKITGSYGWRDEKTLDVVLRYIESPHSEHYVFTFDGNKLVSDWQRSFDFGRSKQTVTASAQ